MKIQIQNITFKKLKMGLRIFFIVNKYIYRFSIAIVGDSW